MSGGILIALVTAVLLPWAFLIGGFVICTIMGWALNDFAEATHADSPLLETNV